ncbi:MAG: bifunctional DNA-binding transcriptional regulator/O6-methylguanine-DNA methyltransferase Ada [Pseudomonas sp.]
MLDHERCWQALCERDANYDGRFVFAVRSTGIFCRPSCPARRPLRANVQFHLDAASAAAAGFRPCKRCTPQGASPAEQLDALVSAACELLDNAEQTLTLTELAARIGLSASHLSRAFKARTGLTPHAWVNARRQQRLHAALPEATSVLAAALQAGYPDTRALYRQAGPRPARPRSASEPLRYGISPCPLGYLLLAASANGVCALLFGDQPAALEAELRQRFASAELQRDDHSLGDWLSAVLSQLHEPARAAHLPLDLRGTAFQQQVWQALQTIPRGKTRRYGDLAAQLATHPRAIARACASNPLGLLVPCHRVVAADGGLSGYRWGVARKEALLAAEAQSAVTTPED